MSKSRKPLRFTVTGALLVGSLSACGGAEVHTNEPQPDVNVAEPETNGVAPAEEAEPVDEPQVNEIEPEPQPEPQPRTNELPPPG